MKSIYTNSYETILSIGSLKNHLNLTNSFYIIDDYFKEKVSDNNQIYWFHALEGNKSLRIAEEILQQMIVKNIKRSDTIIAIGGGITLDIAAFCASIYKRGCRLCLIPTTIIAMIDASIGGKTSLNLNFLKNQVGTFYPAEEVIIDFTLLKTLSDVDIKNGFSELIKIMIIKERSFFEHDFNKIEHNFQEYLFKAIKYKIEITEEDMTDKGYRQVLNLGHTFAHLIETASRNTISHGEAVAKGLYLAIMLSYKKGLLSYLNSEKILSYLKRFCHNYLLYPELINEIKKSGSNILLADKKSSEKVKLVLINDISTQFYHIDDVDYLIHTIVNL